MFRPFALAAAMLCMAAPAFASPLTTQVPLRQSGGEMLYGSSPMLPPAGYTQRWWRSPDNCDYSRAGRPGEIVWYLIINTAHRGCAPYLIQQGFADAYSGMRLN